MSMSYCKCHLVLRHFILSCDIDGLASLTYLSYIMVPILTWKIPIMACSTAITAGFLQHCHHTLVTEREERCVQLSESIWRSWALPGLCVMDENNYQEHPLAWRVQGSGWRLSRDSVGRRLMFMWYNNTEACLFISGPRPTPSPLLSLTYLQSPGPEADPGLIQPFNNKTSLEAENKQERRAAAQSEIIIIF